MLGLTRARPLTADDERAVSPTVAVENDAVWAAALAFAAALVVAMLVLARPLGHLLIPTGGFRLFASSVPQAYPKPTQETRYALAVLFSAGLALLIARGRIPRGLASEGIARTSLRTAAIAGHLTVVGFVAWTWQSQFRGLSGEFPETHFSYDNLAIALLIAATLALLTQLRPRWLSARVWPGGPAPWIALTALLTACWLLPDIFRAQNLAPALIEVTYHLEFTFDDFVAQLNGLTALVNYNAQYASLLPFAVSPVLALGGTTIGAFTSIMCALTLFSLLAIERALAHVTRNELVAFLLYVPILAASLFTVVHVGPQRYDFADYFAVFPLRYFGPYVLFWLCVRHLRGLSPRRGSTLFLFAGLVLLNNVEFGLPALAAAVVGCAAAGEFAQPLRRLARSVVLGLLGALALVSLLTLLQAGQLPELGGLTLYARLFGATGLTLLPTSLDGFQLIIFITFAAALAVAGRRYRRRADDRVLTGALAYSGVFGLGAGSYYMGRSHPVVLVALFSVWALCGALLSLLSLRELARRPVRIAALTRKSAWAQVRLIALIAATLGLAATAIAQVPAPWTQVTRIATTARPPVPYNIGQAVSFVRGAARRGEALVLLAPLGHQIARDAGVKNVSPYSSSADILTYNQLSEVLDALRRNHGTRFFVGEYTAPEIPKVLSTEGFRAVAGPGTGLTEWIRPVPSR
jgi:hypothetical protein